ncbi:MAG: cysteine desulfurase [Phycisphaerae bacterium]|nr:cysteine desulfurase [Phycisphaerae bacterium]
MIYLDNNSTTRPCESAIEALDASARRWWANPSSAHRAGQDARAQVELARAHVAALVGVKPRGITFTASATEAINLAVRGVLDATDERAVVTTATEHGAVRELLAHLAPRRGLTVRVAPIGPTGVLDPDGLEALLLPGTALCIAHWANNETGVVQPVAEVARRCRARGVPFLCDATQWVGKMPADLSAFDLACFSPHKFHGVKGVGALVTRPGFGLVPQMPGAQELGRRGGTESVPAILAAGAAALAAAEFLRDPDARDRLARQRDRFERAVLDGCAACGVRARVNGSTDPAHRLWNTTNLAFHALEAEALLLMLSERGVCASAGAACASGSLEPSPVLLAMGIEPADAHGSLRFSLSRDTTTEEVDRAAGIVLASVRLLARATGTRA